jgi:hypothetical protein
LAREFRFGEEPRIRDHHSVSGGLAQREQTNRFCEVSNTGLSQFVGIRPDRDPVAISSAFERRQQHHQYQQPNEHPQHPFGRFSDHGAPSRAAWQSKWAAL